MGDSSQDGPDDTANAVEKQTDAAMERIISRTQRSAADAQLGYTTEPPEGSMRCQETQGVFAAHGLRCYRETIYEEEISPAGAPPLASAAGRPDAGWWNVADMGFKVGRGRPLPHATQGLVL